MRQIVNPSAEALGYFRKGIEPDRSDLNHLARED
jgi:hypothetical protein